MKPGQLIYTVRRCRDCGGALDTILDLGSMALSNFIAQGTHLHRTPHAPLDLCACATCQLVQLRHTVPPDQLFKEHYWYRSGINEAMCAELADIVKEGIARVPTWQFSDFVLDVGANDGTLLAEYRKHAATKSVPRIAYEPANNLQEALATNAEIRSADYFPPVQWQLKLGGLIGRVKILTSIAMFYDLDEPHDFVEVVSQVLHPQGVWIVQFQDLHQMVRATAFDNICHEHLVYYSLESFERLIAAHGLTVTDAETRPINGGSYRLYVQHRALRAPERRVNQIRVNETGCQSWGTLEKFAWRAGEVRKQIQAAVEESTIRGVVDVYGASTKFNTLAQYCQLHGDAVRSIRQAWERSPEKVGLETITGIPIVSEVNGRADPPAVLLAGIWQFRPQILKREQAYLKAGGTILFPLPTVDAVRWERVPC